jgi:Prolyl oligopeptidase family
MLRYLSTWWVRVLFLIRLVLLIFGCIATLANGALAATWSTTDLKSGAALPSGTTTFNSVTVTWQVGNYLSGGLQIYGLLCTPTSLPGPHPVAILNHGLMLPAMGFPPKYPGIDSMGWTGCTEMAGYGWLTAITTYRGEFITGLPAPYANFRGTSDGSLELCFGEVDDVLDLLSAVTAMPEANANQVLMWGHSHGACITERAIERGAAVQIAVSLDGPTDFTTWSGNNKILAPTIQDQEARSSAWAGNNPSALTDVKFLRVQAEADATVPPAQACELVAKLAGSTNYYIDSNATPLGVYYGAPKECSAFSMPWVNSPPGQIGHVLPDEYGGIWPSPTLLMYSGLSHSLILGKAWPEYASFVNTTAQSGNWHASIPSEYIPYYD